MATRSRRFLQAASAFILVVSYGAFRVPNADARSGAATCDGGGPGIEHCSVGGCTGEPTGCSVGECGGTSTSYACCFCSSGTGSWSAWARGAWCMCTGGI
jgi:hypothetical protein